MSKERNELLPKGLKTFVPDYAQVFINISKPISAVLSKLVEVFLELIEPVLDFIKNPKNLSSYLLWEMLNKK